MVIDCVAGGMALLAAAAVGSCVYRCVTLAAIERFRSRHPVRTTEQPLVSILKPVRGLEADTYACFASYCRLHYPSYELLFGIQDADDPALPILRQLQQDFPAVPMRVVVSDVRCGANLKVCNLVNLLPLARGDILVMSDSDTVAAPDYLDGMVGALADPQVGLVTLVYRGEGAASWSAALESLGLSAAFFPSVALAIAFVSPGFALGPTIALRRDTLARLGGLEPLSDTLAEDYQLGRRVRDLGLQVHFPREVLSTRLPDTRLREVLRHRLRWARTQRICQPAGYAAALLTHGSIWCGLLAALHGFHGPALLLWLGQQALHWFSTLHASRVLGCRDTRRWMWLLPLSDLVEFGLWVASWLGSTVTWRGDSYRVSPGGHLTPLRRTAEQAPAGRLQDADHSVPVVAPDASH